MSKKLLVLGILFGLVSFIFIGWNTSLLVTDAEDISIITTYNEQCGYEKFVKQLPQQVWENMNWNMPFYIVNGGLPRVIHDWETYIKIDELLVQPDSEKPSVEQSEANQETHKKIFLTFDDGPNNKSTLRILEILQKYDVKATFFVLGQNVTKYPEVVQMIHEQGHEIANHSWSHKNLTKLNPEQIHAEMDRTSQAIYDVTGEYPTAYRPPFGAINDEVRAEVSLEPFLWNIDTLDWHHKDPAQTLEAVKAGAKEDGIILMHDIHQQSADALQAVIEYLRQQDYEFVTMSQFK